VKPYKQESNQKRKWKQICMAGSAGVSKLSKKYCKKANLLNKRILQEFVGEEQG
jgi:hypothetical protein